jgi:hypothetical protein
LKEGELRSPRIFLSDENRPLRGRLLRVEPHNEQRQKPHNERRDMPGAKQEAAERPVFVGTNI